MASSQSNIESRLGGSGRDAEWLSSLSEPELDFLISLKELVTRRAKTIGHKYIADKFDVKMLRALGIVLLEYFKEHAENACPPNLVETLALFSGCGLTSQTSDGSMISKEDLQPSGFVTPRRKRMWEGLCEERLSSCKKQKIAKEK